MTVNVLSVKEPWATLIVMGYKDITNRTWDTSYRGKLYIHASKTFDDGAYDFLREIGRPDLIDVLNPILAEIKSGMGHIIGRVDLTDCRYSTDWSIS